VVPFLSRIDRSGGEDSDSPGPLVTITGGHEREAADAVRAIFERTLEELGLSPDETEALELGIAESYVRGRSDGAAAFARQVNLALSAEAIPMVVVAQHDTADTDAQN
jgi:hypothetical protein